MRYQSFEKPQRFARASMELALRQAEAEACAEVASCMDAMDAARDGLGRVLREGGSPEAAARGMSEAEAALLVACAVLRQRHRAVKDMEQESLPFVAGPVTP